MNTTRRHRGLPLALAFTAAIVVTACDSPTGPAPLTLNAKVASIDSSSCNRGFIVIQGAVQCMPD